MIKCIQGGYMKVLLYTEGLKTIGKSGLGKAIKHQEKALQDNHIDYTTNIKDDFDILKFAEMYSLFLTDDLAHGVYGHGFSKLSPYLIKDSYMYEMAHGWAYQVDITFVSNHRLKNPTFTNESVSNFIIYNDNAFSCEVNLEKNMTVNNEDRIDKMHERLYFIYYNDGYKLVDMRSI